MAFGKCFSLRLSCLLSFSRSHYHCGRFILTMHPRKYFYGFFAPFSFCSAHSISPKITSANGICTFFRWVFFSLVCNHKFWSRWETIKHFVCFLRTEWEEYIPEWPLNFVENFRVFKTMSTEFVFFQNRNIHKLSCGLRQNHFNISSYAFAAVKRLYTFWATKDMQRSDQYVVVTNECYPKWPNCATI